VALILVGGTTVKASGNQIAIGDSTVATTSPVIHDGLIAAYGRLYAATLNGELVCFE
jgi:hypothetical protein